MAYKRPESVLVVIYDTEGLVLTLQRKDDPDFWQSVTGSIEAGETPAETAQREVLEEIGVDALASGYAMVETGEVNVYQIREYWRHRYGPGVTQNKEFVFLLQIPQGTDIVLSEHLCFQWLSPQAAVEKMWSDSNKQAIEKHLINP